MAEQSPAHDGIAHLNSIFYSTSPATYFWQRLNSLLVVAAGDEEYGPLLRAGIQVGSEGFTVDEDELIRTEMTPDDLKSHIVAESVIILSHVSESLLRTFLGHDGFDSSFGHRGTFHRRAATVAIEPWEAFDARSGTGPRHLHRHRRRPLRPLLPSHRLTERQTCRDRRNVS
jgi:hypothetical protein